MYSPDQHAIDTRNAANVVGTDYPYSICEYKFDVNSRVSIDHISDERYRTDEEAKADLLALTKFHGEELSVLHFDDEGDATCVFCAEWDNALGRYVEA